MVTQIVDTFKNNQFWIFPSLQFFSLILFTWVLNRNYKRGSAFLSMRSFTSYLVVQAFYLPLLALIYLSCLKLLLPYLTKYAPETLMYVDFDKVYQVIIFAIFIWFIGRFTGVIKAYFLSSKLTDAPLSERMVYFTFELFYWTLMLIFVLGSFYILQIEISDTFHILGKGIIICSFTTIVLYIVHVFINEKIKIFFEQGEFLYAVLFKIISKPLLMAILGTGILSWIYWTSLQYYLNVPFSFEHVFVLCFFWSLFRSSTLIEKEFLLGRLTRHYPDKTRVQVVGNLTRVLTVLLGILFFLDNKVAYARSAMTFLGGAMAFAIGFAARPIIANYLSGFIMHFEGNMSVGDWIYSTDKSIEGVIEYMGMRITTLRTLDKRVLYVPNSFFSEAKIVNATKMTNRRIDAVIPIERAAPSVVEEVVHEVRKMLQEHPDIDQYLPTMAHIMDCGPASLHISIRTFTMTKDLKIYRTIHQDIFLKVVEIAEKHGVGLAPTHILAKEDLTSGVKKTTK